MLVGNCVLSARQRGGKILFFLAPAHHCSLNRTPKFKASSQKTLTKPSRRYRSLGKILPPRSLPCRHYLSAPPRNRESDGMIDAKTNLPPSCRAILRCHFGLRIESRHRCGSARTSKQKDPWPRSRSAPGQAACPESAHDK